MPTIDLLDADILGHRVSKFLTSAQTPGLDDGPGDAVLSEELPGIVKELKWQGSLLEAGLWLLAGDLERSHAISQDHGSAEGSFWHGIMHRREGDYGNSKYWFRRVGMHPVLHELAELNSDRGAMLTSDLPIEPLCEPESLADTLIDNCQAALTRRSGWKDDLEQICWWEWQLLFRYCLNS